MQSRKPWSRSKCHFRFLTSNFSAEREERFALEQDDNTAQFMDDSYLPCFLLSSNEGLCRIISLQFEALRTILINMIKELDCLKQIQNLLGTQDFTLLLQAE